MLCITYFTCVSTDPTYVSVDVVRARKTDQLAHHLEQPQTTPTNKGIKDPKYGMLSGGIMETRIGTVGVAMTGRLPLLPDNSAQMY